MGIRSRICIPGGTCEFDLPSYYAWQHKTGVSRQADLNLQWIGHAERRWGMRCTCC
jgi:cell division protein ZapD